MSCKGLLHSCRKVTIDECKKLGRNWVFPSEINFQGSILGIWININTTKLSYHYQVAFYWFNIHFISINLCSLWFRHSYSWEFLLVLQCFYGNAGLWFSYFTIAVIINYYLLTMVINIRVNTLPLAVVILSSLFQAPLTDSSLIFSKFFCCFSSVRLQLYTKAKSIYFSFSILFCLVFMVA